MRYYIHGVDGQIYGPAELDGINLWIAEGRVVPTTLLQPEGTESRIAASTLPGLKWAEGQTFEAYTPQVLRTARYELAGAWICFGASIILCCFPFGVHLSLGVGGIILSVLAYRKGRSVAMVALVLNLIVVGLFLWMRLRAGSGTGIDPQAAQKFIRQFTGR